VKENRKFTLAKKNRSHFGFWATHIHIHINIHTFIYFLVFKFEKKIKFMEKNTVFFIFTTNSDFFVYFSNFKIAELDK
jgi:hypothetical protein